jgi:hypothetical protein
MKINLTILFLFSVQLLIAQRDTLSDVYEGRSFINNCIDSLIERNVMYNSVLGITMQCNKEGILKKVEISFGNNELELKRSDRKYLIELLSEKNYIEVLRVFYTENEMKSKSRMVIRMKYLRD